ncbi:MAG: hypothetical protein M1511_19850 [Deltaproteobacteria bacterium]|nr:hypothetical protein [Deltaproteobacteria bacterium]
MSGYYNSCGRGPSVRAKQGKRLEVEINRRRIAAPAGHTVLKVYKRIFLIKGKGRGASNQKLTTFSC